MDFSLALRLASLTLRSKICIALSCGQQSDAHICEHSAASRAQGERPRWLYQFRPGPHALQRYDGDHMARSRSPLLPSPRERQCGRGRNYSPNMRPGVAARWKYPRRRARHTYLQNFERFRRHVQVPPCSFCFPSANKYGAFVEINILLPKRNGLFGAKPLVDNQ